VISLQDVDDRNAYRPEDAQFLTFVAGQLVAALQRVQIEAARKESREYFAKSFHTSPAIMLLVGLESGRIIEANTAFLRASGFAREEIVGARSLDLGIWPDPAEREKVLARLQQTGAVHGYETRLLNKSGEPRYVLLNVDRIELSGSPSMLITAIDITERRRAEEAVRKAEARYRGIFENALEGLYTSTPEGRFLNVNPAFARMLGYATPADLLAQVGDIAREFYADSKRRDEFFRLLGLADEITDFESQVYGRDGRKIWISESVRAVRDADGRLDHLEGVAVDITAQRETARALQIAKEAADTANRAKSHFLASMSHELRTPLNGILGYTQILRRDAALTDKQRAGLGIIQDSADHLLALINDVLDLAKIEARKLELHPTDFDLPAFARAVADFFLPRAREKNLLLEANIARDLPRHVRGDVPRLRQVCYNLLSNAVKFTARGSVIFSVERSGDRLRFSVSDTGPGISPDDQALLFEPFAQIGDQSRHAEGTGLGLNVSRGIVEQMGGQLRLDSRPGWGSRFWFEIALPSTTAAEAVATDAGARRVTGYLGARRKLLVADDHDANRQLLRDLLEPLGFEVRDAPDGTVAVQVARTWQPDLVLLDLKMPRLDGFAAARAIRKALPDATTKIIGMSASAFDSDRQACLDAGCAEFLPKPLREAQLLAALERQLGLVWQYTDGGETVSPFPAMEHAPEIADAEAIHDLACKGDVVAVRAYAQKLAERDPRLAPFAQAVTDLAARFKMKAIRQFVGRYRKDGSGRPFL
jgi:PAS domain S-box-containing protein